MGCLFVFGENFFAAEDGEIAEKILLFRVYVEKGFLNHRDTEEMTEKTIYHGDHRGHRERKGRRELFSASRFVKNLIRRNHEVILRLISSCVFFFISVFSVSSVARRSSCYSVPLWL